MIPTFSTDHRAAGIRVMAIWYRTEVADSKQIRDFRVALGFQQYLYFSFHSRVTCCLLLSLR